MCLTNKINTSKLLQDKDNDSTLINLLENKSCSLLNIITVTHLYTNNFFLSTDEGIKLRIFAYSACIQFFFFSICKIL